MMVLDMPESNIIFSAEIKLTFEAKLMATLITKSESLFVLGCIAHLKLCEVNFTIKNINNSKIKEASKSRPLLL